MCHFLSLQNLVGRQGSILGKTGCQIYGVISTFASLAEIWTLVLISVDRKDAIAHPLAFSKRISSHQVLIDHFIIYFSKALNSFLFKFSRCIF